MVFKRSFGKPSKGHVIVVHGLGEHFRRHHRLIEELKKHGYKVHTFDWPGHGMSPGTRGHTTVEECVDIIDSMVKDIQGEPFLFGHSLGGLAVLRYAEEKPSRIKGVVSSSPALQPSEDTSGFTVALASLLSYIVPHSTISNSIRTRDLTSSKKERKKYREDEMVHDRISFALARSLFYNMKKAHNGRLNVPVLILAGTEDKITPMEGAQRFVNGLECEDKELSIFQGAFHEIFNEPELQEKYYDEILGWLEECS
ncbi:MAG: alpha/beta hydrolase [Thermoplasmata archaeon]